MSTGTVTGTPAETSYTKAPTRLLKRDNGTTTVSYDDWMEDTIDTAGTHTMRTVHYKAIGQMIANRAISLAPGSPPADQAPVTWYTHDQVNSISASRPAV